MGIVSLFLDRVAAFAATLGSAAAASAAVEAGRKPSADDLLQLGIDPAAFTSIGHG